MNSVEANTVKSLRANIAADERRIAKALQRIEATKARIRAIEGKTDGAP